MAKGGERRMVFDTRGRRKHVVRVVYAILALLMGTSLFLVVGPFNVGQLIGNSGPTNATQALEDQAGRIETRLQRSPSDEGLLLSLARTRINVGNTLLETNPQTGVPLVTPEARAEFKQGVEAWSRYLEQADAPNPAAAGIVARTYFSLAETSESYVELEENISGAAETQDLTAKARPSVGALTTLAIYKYFDGDFAAGDKATKRAQRLVRSKAEAKAVATQLAPYRQRAKQYQKQAQKFAKAQQGKAKEALQNPLGELAGGGSPLGP